MRAHSALTFLLLGACGTSGDGGGEPLPSRSFSEFFEARDSVTLELTNARSFIQISGIDVGPNGNIVATDASDGAAYLFSSDGKLVKVLGRRGSGPGDFQTPRAPRIGPDGVIHIHDARLRRITVFTPAGELKRTVPLRELMNPATFELLSDGKYLFAGLRRPDDHNVLFVTDASGTVINSSLLIGNTRPTGSRPNPAWRQVRRPSVTFHGDFLAVVLSISDSLWLTHDFARVQSSHIPISKYAPPNLPRSGLRSINAAREWGRSFTTVADIFSVDAHLLILIVRGVLYEGDERAGVLQDRSGDWVNLHDVPVIFRSRGSDLIGTVDPKADHLKLTFYRVKQG